MNISFNCASPWSWTTRWSRPERAACVWVREHNYSLRAPQRRANEGRICRISWAILGTEWAFCASHGPQRRKVEHPGWGKKNRKLSKLHKKRLTEHQVVRLHRRARVSWIAYFLMEISMKGKTQCFAASCPEQSHACHCWKYLTSRWRWSIWWWGRCLCWRTNELTLTSLPLLFAYCYY